MCCSFINEIKITMSRLNRDGLVIYCSSATDVALETCCIPVVKEHITTVFEEGQAIAPAPFSKTVVSNIKKSDFLNLFNVQMVAKSYLAPSSPSASAKPSLTRWTLGDFPIRGLSLRALLLISYLSLRQSQLN